MEEKKNENIVKMNGGNAESRPEKMSYEQLENIAHQLSEQAKQLYTQLQEANMVNLFKRLDYLFKVIDNRAAFDEEFLEKCKSEIVELMTINPQETAQEEE